MNDTLDLTHLRGWIGREETTEDLLTPSLVDRFRATIGLGGVSACKGDIAPPLIHFCLCQPAVSTGALGVDGHPARGGFLPPVPLPRRMWAASAIAFRNDLRVGAVVRRRSQIADIAAKAGRTGSLCFVTIEHMLQADGVVALSERQTIVYREASGVAPPLPPVPAPAGATVEMMAITPTLLFRYSALTFNGHRIHYDRPYAMNEEGYPGLVVHGPLQATLLVDLAMRCHGGKRPDRFSFRGLSPAFDGTALGIHAGELNNGALELWTAPSGGAIAMQAVAEWN